MRISVIICTLNRATYLKQTLEALKHQVYGDFEVVIVNGPSSDNTAEVLTEFKDRIRAYECNSRNISMARNIGVKVAKGDIVAFLDDDAIPDHFWLESIEKSFQEHDFSVVGGFVFDNSGYSFQARYILADRCANTESRDELFVNQATFCYPGASRFLTPMGCNFAVKRQDIVSVGGFDEQFDYFLDETDLVIRMIDKGFKVHIDQNILVYHKFAPSSIRRAKWPLNWESIIKNRLYFICANNFGKIELEAAVEEVQCFVDSIIQQTKDKCRSGELNSKQGQACISSAIEGIKEGKKDVVSNMRKQIRDVSYFDSMGSFYPFRTVATYSNRPLVICLLSPSYPPASTDGIPRYTKNLAEGMTKSGCIVHVVTLDTKSSTVGLENGVWVHRIHSNIAEDCSLFAELGIDYRKSISTYRAEVLRIENQIHHVDIIQGPIWDLAPLGLLHERHFITGLFMCTSFAIKKEIEPEWYRANKDIVDQIVKYEHYMIRNAGFLNFDSQALFDDCLRIYGDSVERVPHRILHLGTTDPGTCAIVGKRIDTLDILFVGRLERRKGIDIVLAAIKPIVLEFPNVRFIIVGQDVRNEQGMTYKAKFFSENIGKDFLQNVSFVGYIPDEKLRDYYANCDIFVCPSRYESFGQMVVEAMAYGKPIISTRVGGITELLEDQKSGLLTRPGDEKEFYLCLKSLILDREKRLQLGQAARKRFESMFSVESMCLSAEEFFRDLRDARSINE